MSILAVTEQRSGTLRPVSLEVTTAARRSADDLDAEVAALLVGPPGLRDDARRLADHGADRVLVAAAEGLDDYQPEVYREAVVRAVERTAPDAVFFAASAQGKDLAPRIAARIKAPLATEITEVAVEDGDLVAVRPIYAGKIFARVRFNGSPAMLSVRPRAYQPEETPREVTIEELELEVDTAALRGRVHFEPEEKKERPDVSEADVVVSGGRGMQDPENWPLLEELADALGSGTALGASRAVVDAGWRPHAEQVGQTGKVVSPKLYFAIGISGAIQHQAGMRTSGCIVAVNKDPEAPIFELADYGIVGDLFEVVPRLTEEIQELRAAG